MPENKVYHKDPYLKEWESMPVSSKTDERGSWYSFQDTIFYPQGGGQSSDKGWINSIDVLDVQFAEGEIWHLLDSPISEKVSMRLDWNHRYTNMQQHTGQHLLSACLKNLHNLDTMSVHLGSDVTMIELDPSDIEIHILNETEKSANQMIRDNLPVESIVVNQDELENYQIRRPIKTKDEQVRLVRIGEIDCVGCGGIHVSSTAEVGLIKILGLEKIRGRVRIKIKIGTSAYQYFDQLHQTLHGVSTTLTTSIQDLPDRIESLQTEKRELISEKKRYTELWLSELAKNLNTDELTGCFILRDLSKDQLKILSEQFVEQNKKPCLFISEDSGHKHFFIRLPEKLNKNIQDFIQKYKMKYGLKGGGAKDFAVGQIDSENVSSFFPEMLFNSFNEFVIERSDN